MVAGAPLIVVVAGPNGVGKSTTAPLLLRKALSVSEFVNADQIALGLSAFKPEAVAISAGRVMMDRIKTLAQSRVDFAFETTLASRGFAPWLKELRDSGYRVHLAFLSLPDPALALARVAERVRMGGHDVPEAVVVRRYYSGLSNFFSIYKAIVDTWQVFDNTQLSGPHLIAYGSAGKSATIVDPLAWDHLKEKTR